MVVSGQYYHGSIATYTCNKYYILTGVSTLRCVYGKWKGKIPTCERKNQIIACKSDYQFSNNDKILRFSYHQILAIRCPKLVNPEYGKVAIVGDYLHDSTATYSCIKDYEVHGEPTRKCIYGRWGGKAPLCLRKSIITTFVYFVVIKVSNICSDFNSNQLLSKVGES